jgi:hypothetical protein
MPQFRIPVEKLPPPNKDGDHVFRFRIISEDQNRLSTYSSIFIVKSLGQVLPLPSPSVAEVSAGGGLINVTWETPSYYNVGENAFPPEWADRDGISTVSASVLHNHEGEWKVHDSDIFVKWGYGSPVVYDEPFEYYGRSRDNQVSILTKENATSAIIVGCVAFYDSLENKQPSDLFQIFSKEVSI